MGKEKESNNNTKKKKTKKKKEKRNKQENIPPPLSLPLHTNLPGLSNVLIESLSAQMQYYLTYKKNRSSPPSLQKRKEGELKKGERFLHSRNTRVHLAADYRAKAPQKGKNAFYWGGGGSNTQK